MILVLYHKISIALWLATMRYIQSGFFFSSLLILILRCYLSTIYLMSQLFRVSPSNVIWLKFSMRWPKKHLISMIFICYLWNFIYSLQQMFNFEIVRYLQCHETSQVKKHCSLWLTMQRQAGFVSKTGILLLSSGCSELYMNSKLIRLSCVQ